MKLFISILAIFIFIVSSNLKAEQTEEFKKLLDEYSTNYNFFSIKDTLYTIQTEFILPENFSHINPPDKSSYSFWISNFPIWHGFKSVGNWQGNKEINYDEISRVVHLPWNGLVFKDYAIPTRLLGEFFFQTNKRFSLQLLPINGEVLTYEKWLKGKPSYKNSGELIFKNALIKDDTENEFYKYIIFCMQNISYESFAKSCDTVAIANLQAGDMMIAYDSTGNVGKLFIILHLISNKAGDIMYLIANGCSEACDFHIPKLTDDRNNPWITIKQLQELTTGFENRNFYRFKQ